MPHGELLIGFVEAALSGDGTGLPAARAEVRHVLGDAAFVDACAVIASFNAVVKVADAVGIPLEAVKEAATRDLRAELALHRLNERHGIRLKRNKALASSSLVK